jgi:hypothetical protein
MFMLTFAPYIYLSTFILLYSTTCQYPLRNLRFAKPHARATAICADQFHAGRFKGPLDDLEGRPPRQRLAGLEQPNCHNAYPRLVSQLLLCPVEEAARGAALTWRKHGDANTRF